MTDEMTLPELGERRATLRVELDEITERIKPLALAALDAGRSEVVVARESGIDRMTLRKWLGKGKPKKS